MLKISRFQQTLNPIIRNIYYLLKSIKMRIKIKVIPNSKKSEIIKDIQEKDFLKIKVNAPAQKGKANKKLVGILAEYFNVPKAKIKIIKGEKSHNKIVEILE